MPTVLEVVDSVFSVSDLPVVVTSISVSEMYLFWLIYLRMKSQSRACRETFSSNEFKAASGRP